MAGSESILLRRFAETGDAVAFSEIIRRHAGLVYGASLRVLQDKDEAADVAQETFLQLLHDAGKVTGSLAGWLHRVATHKAVDSIRRDSRRRRREADYIADRPLAAAEWHDISGYVDQALDELEAPVKETLIEYFFEARSMTDIASEKGTSHQTVSRTIESAVTQLRAKLRRRGLIVAAAALSGLLAQNAVEAAPAAVLQELGKMALAGTQAAAASAVSSAAVHSGAAAKTAASALLGGIQAKIITATAIAAVGIGGVFSYNYLTSRNEQESGPKTQNALLRDERSVNRTATPGPGNQVTSTEVSIATTSVGEAAGHNRTNENQPAFYWYRTAGKPDDSEKSETKNFDLGTPEETVRSFIKMFAEGNKKSVLACFMPGGVDYEDINHILYPDPSLREHKTNIMLQQWLSSFDPDAEMPITRKEETEHGLEVAWLATFKNDFTMKGRTFRAGETMELDASLKKVGDKWLIDNF